MKRKTSPSQSPTLVRGLGIIDSTSLVIGTMIGTGVFLKSSVMAQGVGSSSVVLLAWVVAGFLSLLGALSYAELGSLFPQAGGEYVYLREAYGEVWAFLYGWMRFWIGAPGAIAAYAVGIATFVDTGWMRLEALPLGKSGVAVGLIAFFSALNCLSVVVSGGLQALLTTLKIAMIVGLACGVFFLSPHVGWQGEVASTGWAGWSAFGSAMLASLWAYDGWSNLPMVAGEVRNPQRNVPLALVLGVGIVLVVYLMVNVAYFAALPFAEVLTSSSSSYPDALPVAAKAARTFLGERGSSLLTFAFVLSAAGAMNGGILTGARVPYAMAQDGLFFKRLGRVTENTRVPAVSVLVQGAIACVLALSGTFDQLTDYVIFWAWIFYGAVAASVFVFRRKIPHAPRAYRVVGYPVLPAIFILLSALLVINSLVTSPISSAIGLVLILLGLPVYRFGFKR